MISRVAYGGWPNNVKLSNGSIELIATLDVGPRIIRFGFTGKPNVMKEFADQMGKSGESEWMNRGGHRLWHAPEAKPRTYPLDNSPVKVEEMGDFAIKLTPPVEAENGIQKEIEIVMAADDNLVSVTHRITNTGRWDIELAPWALTVMDQNGLCIIPLPEKQSHTEVLVPDFPLVQWPYTDMADSRFHWGTRYITLKQDPSKPPTKIGLALKLGWAAYLVNNTLFAKYFDYDPDAIYPDFGCNFETFSNEDMLEVESLGPMELLEPGETIEHDETWRLVDNVQMVSTEAEIDAKIRPLVEVG